MSSLHSLQTTFASAIQSGRSDTLAKYCSGSKDVIQKGLTAYRRNVYGNLSAALKASYPIIANIVGHDFFAMACRSYVDQHPSTSGNLNHYGAHFSAFIANFATGCALPYLADIAALEWLVQTVENAADAPVQDLSLLTITPAEHWGDLRFTLDTAHALKASNWPIVDIWSVNQPTYVGSVEVDFTRAQIALIRRTAQGICIETINDGELALLQALNVGHPLHHAVALANKHSEFDLQPSLSRFFSIGLFNKAH